MSFDHGLQFGNCSFGVFPDSSFSVGETGDAVCRCKGMRYGAVCQTCTQLAAHTPEHCLGLLGVNLCRMEKHQQVVKVFWINWPNPVEEKS